MSRFMKSSYEYTKKRKNCGRQPLFQNVPAQLLDSIVPNKEDQKCYVLRNPVNRSVQATRPQAINESNTSQVVLHEQSINHVEGGWPREVHLYNEDHLQRHRRRVMHDDNYINTVLNLTPRMLHYVDQNNAIEMYQTYFSDIPPQDPIEKCSIRIANVFRDTHRRPVSCVKWTKEKNPKLAVAYCYKSCVPEPEPELNLTNNIYLWDVHRQTEPVEELQPELPCWQLACSPVNPNLLISGLENGTVHVFDIRANTTSIAASSVYNSHHNAVTSLLYITSRTNTEFFTGSSDGQCLWWDSRNLSKPLVQLPMSVRLSHGQTPDLSNSEGVSTLEFDHGFPTKFLCGTESGLVINANRLGRSHSEILVSYWEAHDGAVHAVERSPCTLRMFLTCGDFTVKIWSEEVRTAPIIVTKPYRYLVTDAAWAPLRYSCYMSICAGGMFYYWDLLRKYKEPVATLKVSKHELTRITPHAEGESIAIGNSNGSIYLLQLSENMVMPGSRDKVLTFQTYERETRREHILDNRVKEIRLKAKVEEEMAAAAAAAAVVKEDEIVEEEEEDRATEEEYFRIVQEELLKMGGMPGHTSVEL